MEGPLVPPYFRGHCSFVFGHNAPQLTKILLRLSSRLSESPVGESVPLIKSDGHNPRPSLALQSALRQGALAKEGRWHIGTRLVGNDWTRETVYISLKSPEESGTVDGSQRK